MKQETQVMVSLTDSLKLMIDHYKKTMSKDEFDRFMMRLYDGICFYREQFSKIPEGYNRAYNVHRFIDELLEEDKKVNQKDWTDISCRKGCSACCYKTVIATDDEADLLVQYCKDEGIEIDVEHLKGQANFKGTSAQWFDRGKDKARCVFLKDNECSVYEHRPAACRKFYVISDPEKCGGRSGREILVKVSLNVEMAASGAMDIDHKRVGDLPDQLLKRLEKEESSGAVREPNLLSQDARRP